MRMELAGSGIHVSLIEPGPVVSRIAPNALPWFERYVDHENSVHRDAYRAQLARMNAGGSKSRLKLTPEAVYVVLLHALLSPKPRPHYVVTLPAKIGVALKRILPAHMLYRVLASQS
jgi:short-subunit dehydrogenase